MEWEVAYVLLGAFIGFLAGLLGIGGGVSMVPILSLMFVAQDFPPAHLLHLAVGTALSSVVFTSISSARTHNMHGAVRWDIFRALSPGTVVGTLIGAAFAGMVSTRWLALFFSGFVYLAATQMLLNLKPKAARDLPGPAGIFAFGLVFGAISSLIAAGGAMMTVPFMTWCNVKLHDAIGTSSAIGLPIAVAGTAGYIATGWNQPDLPAHSIGYVYLPALAGVVVASMLTAPAGARLAHKLPVLKLRRLFALLLYILATKMLSTVLS
jgi:uncharacterized membrane protein YfcA